MPDVYMQRLAELTGLRPCTPKEYPIEEIEDPVVGLVDGYIVAAGPSEDTFVVFVRFSPGGDEELVQSTINNRLAAEFPDIGLEATVCRHPETLGEHSTDTPDAVWALWPFSGLSDHPEAEEIARLITVVIETLKPLASPNDPQCEICGLTRVTKMSLRNGVPGYYCSTCRRKATTEIEAKRSALESTWVDYRKAVWQGTLVAVLTGAAMGCTASLLIPLLGDYGYWVPVVGLFGTGVFILPVYKTTTKAAGRVLDDGVIKLTLALIVVEMVITLVAYYSFVAYSYPGTLLAAVPRSALELFLQNPMAGLGILVGLIFFGCFSAIQGGFRQESLKQELDVVTYEELDDAVERA